MRDGRWEKTSWAALVRKMEFWVVGFFIYGSLLPTWCGSASEVDLCYARASQKGAERAEKWRRVASSQRKKRSFGW